MFAPRLRSFGQPKSSALLLVAIAVTLTPLSVLALKTASMKLPPGFAESAEHLPIDGYGGANRGSFTIGDDAGEFTRVESRLSVFDGVLSSNRGSASFSLRGPEIAGTIESQCSFEQNVAAIGIVTFDPKALKFVCDLSGDSAGLSGRLVLGQPKAEGFRQRMLAQANRQGSASFGVTTVAIESVHEYSGSRLKSQAPVGYLLRLGSTVVAALELTDVNPSLFLARDLAGQERLAVLSAAIAVSLLRDPENSALED